MRVKPALLKLLVTSALNYPSHKDRLLDIAADVKAGRLHCEPAAGILWGIVTREGCAPATKQALAAIVNHFRVSRATQARRAGKDTRHA